jgi:hypothetical protein
MSAESECPVDDDDILFSWEFACFSDEISLDEQLTDPESHGRRPPACGHQKSHTIHSRLGGSRLRSGPYTLPETERYSSPEADSSSMLNSFSDGHVPAIAGGFLTSCFPLIERSVINSNKFESLPADQN